MTKTKTATIEIYTPYGTSHIALDIRYRGKLLYWFAGHDLTELVGKAHRWVYNSEQKFTGTKTKFIK
jgi:hypothetical protein